MAGVGSAYFSFESTWWLRAAPAAVRDVVVDLERYPQWWPQVRAVATLGEDDARVLIRSVLPYTLDLVLHAVSRELPRLRVEIGGDLAGWAEWTLSPVGDGTRMRFAQEVELLGVPVPVVRMLRPVLAWNHHRMMAGARSGLVQLLA